MSVKRPKRALVTDGFYGCVKSSEFPGFVIYSYYKDSPVSFCSAKRPKRTNRCI